jgi:hypothetical protein
MPRNGINRSLVFQDFDGNNQSVLVVIIIDHSVEDVGLPVGSASCEQRISTGVRVIGNLVDDTFVRFQTTIRLFGEFCVEPLRVGGRIANDEVFTFWVNANASCETTRALETLDEFVSEEVVAADGVCGGEEEVRFGRMELAIGDDFVELAERAEDFALREVQHDCLAVLDVILGAKKCQIITAVVPIEATNTGVKNDFHDDTSATFVGSCFDEVSADLFLCVIIEITSGLCSDSFILILRGLRNTATANRSGASSSIEFLLSLSGVRGGSVLLRRSQKLDGVIVDRIDGHEFGNEEEKLIFDGDSEDVEGWVGAEQQLHHRSTDFVTLD